MKSKKMMECGLLSAVPKIFSSRSIGDIKNTVAHDYVANFVQNAKENGRGVGLYIHGGNGKGKTELISAMFNTLKSGDNGIQKLPVYYVRFCDIENAIKMATTIMPFSGPNYDPEDENHPLNKWIEADNFIDDLKTVPGLLFIDDIASGKMTDVHISKLFEIINARYESANPVIYTSNWSLKELEGILFTRVCSRIDRTCKLIELT